MRIDPKANIAGLPILRVRDALKKLAGREWSAERLQEALGADPSEIVGLLEALRSEGFVEPSPGPDHWRTTSRGHAFALATARPVSRAAAQRHLDAFLARLLAVRDDARWLYRARRVYLFGSFLDPVIDVVGDVDLAIELIRKETDEEVHRQRERAYIQRQWDEGRIFRSFRQETMCPSEDVTRYLKHRSWILSLHPLADLPRSADAPSRLVYEDPGA
jgi:DNA-binding IclR family transcriptional regulator